MGEIRKGISFKIGRELGEEEGEWVVRDEEKKVFDDMMEEDRKRGRDNLCDEFEVRREIAKEVMEEVLEEAVYDFLITFH